MTTSGNITTGTAVNPMISEVLLVDSPENIGDTCIAFLSQDTSQHAQWTLTFFAQTDMGSYVMGQVLTRVPGVAGEPFSRAVASAYCPGAKGWKVIAQAVNDVPEQSTLQIKSSHCCAGLTGVRAIPQGPSNPDAPRTFVDQNNAIVSTLIAAAPAQLWSVQGQMVEVGAGLSQWIMVFDKAVAPVNGDTPIWSKHIGNTPATAPTDGSFWKYQVGPLGRPILHGLWVAVSTGPVTLTISTDHTDLHAEVSI